MQIPQFWIKMNVNPSLLKWIHLYKFQLSTNDKAEFEWELFK
jgi:hypothetical protein